MIRKVITPAYEYYYGMVLYSAIGVAIFTMAWFAARRGDASVMVIFGVVGIAALLRIQWFFRKHVYLSILHDDSLAYNALFYKGIVRKEEFELLTYNSNFKYARCIVDGKEFCFYLDLSTYQYLSQFLQTTSESLDRIHILNLPKDEVYDKQDWPRRIKPATIFDVLKQKPRELFAAFYLILFSSLIIGVGIVASNSMDKTIPNVDYVEINKTGMLATGEIIDIEIQNKVTVNQKHPVVISYKFNNGIREIVSKSQVFDPSRTDKMSIGDRVDVKYVNDSSIIAGIEPYTSSVDLFTLGPIPLLLLGIALLVRRGLDAKRLTDLFRCGIIRTANVLALTPKPGSGFPGINETVLVRYDYQTKTGETVYGESRTTDLSIMARIKEGDQIRIFVSPTDESKSTLVPRLEAIKNNSRN